MHLAGLYITRSAPSTCSHTVPRQKARLSEEEKKVTSTKNSAAGRGIGRLCRRDLELHTLVYLLLLILRFSKANFAFVFALQGKLNSVTKHAFQRGSANRIRSGMMFTGHTSVQTAQRSKFMTPTSNSRSCSVDFWKEKCESSRSCSSFELDFESEFRDAKPPYNIP